MRGKIQVDRLFEAMSGASDNGYYVQIWKSFKENQSRYERPQPDAPKIKTVRVLSHKSHGNLNPGIASYPHQIGLARRPN